jgi:hypothetical protein
VGYGIVFREKNMKAAALTPGMPSNQRGFGSEHWCFSQSANDGVQQLGVFHRLGQIRSNANLAAAFSVTAHAGGAQHEDSDRTRIKLLHDARGEFESVRFRHLSVGDNKPEAISAGAGTSQEIQSGQSAVCGHPPHLPISKNFQKDLTVRRIVVHDEDGHIFKGPQAA